MLVPSIFRSNLTDDLFNDIFNMPFGFQGLDNANSLMNADVKELDRGYEMELELPGYKKEDISAELKEGYLTIQAERKEDNEEKDEKGKYIRRERYYGQCQRSFYVGEDLKQEDIHAVFKDGVLKLEIPKVEVKPVIEQKQTIMIE